ncbi:Cytoplasmic dynein 1 heavy chain 1 [Glugoides intestinalis]
MEDKTDLTLRKKELNMFEELESIKDSLAIPIGDCNIELKILKVLQMLIKSKEKKMLSSAFKDPDEYELIKLLNKLINLVNKQEANNKQPTIPSTLQKLFLMQKVYHNQNVIYSYSNRQIDLQRYEGELVKTAEQWIAYLKVIFTKLNHRSRSFFEEKQFWIEFRNEVTSTYNFSVSEEFSFIMNMLKETGHLALMYSLNTLISDQRIYNVCEAFNNVYNKFNFTFLQTADETVISTKDVFSQKNQLKTERFIDAGASSGFTEKTSFFSNVLMILNIIKDLKIIPRVIRKSLCTNLELAKKTILQEALVNFHPLFYDVILSFSELAMILNRKNDVDAEESRILIDKLEDLTKYKEIVAEICVSTEIFTNLPVEGAKDMKKEIANLINEHLEILKERIIENEHTFKHLIRVKPEDLNIKQQKQSIFTQKVFLGILDEKINKFITHDPVKIKESTVLFQENSVYFRIPYFREQVQKQVNNILHSLSNFIYNLNLQREDWVLYDQTLSKSDLVSDFEKIMKVADALELYNTISDTIEQQILANISKRVSQLEKVLEKYIISLPETTLDQFILEPYNMDYLNTNDPKLDDLNLFEVKELYLYDKINHINIVAIDKKLGIKYKKFIQDVQKNWPIQKRLEEILNRYKQTLKRSGKLFADNRIESFFRKIALLKWKGFKEEFLDDINSLFTVFETRVSLFDNEFEKLPIDHIPTLIREKKSISIPNIALFFTEKNKELVEESLKLLRERIATLILISIKNRVEKHQVLLDLSFEENCTPTQTRIFCCTQKHDVSASSVLRCFSKKLDVHDELLSHHLPCVTSFKREIDIEIEALSRKFNLLENNNFKVESKSSVFTALDKLEYLVSIKEVLEQLSSDTFAFFHIISRINEKALQKLLLKAYKDFSTHSYEYISHISAKIREIVESCSTSKDISFLDLLKYKVSALESYNKIEKLLNKYKSLKERSKEKQDTYLDEVFSPAFIKEQASPSPPELFESLLFTKNSKPLNLELSSFRKIMTDLFAFDLKLTLEKEEFRLLKEKREELQFSINRIENLCSFFPADEITFQPLLAQLKLGYSTLEEELSIYNNVFSFYKFEKLSITVQVKTLEDEYQAYISKRDYINQYMKHPIKEVSITFEHLSYQAEKMFSTSLMCNMNERIKKLERPLSFIEELQKLFVELPVARKNKHFNFDSLLEEYLEAFDEEKMQETIETIKIDIEIAKYLKEERKRAIDIIKVVEDGIYITNTDEIKIYISTLRSSINLVLRYNKYNLYQKELDEIDSFISKQEELFDLLCNTKEKFFELNTVFSKNGMELESLKFISTKEQFYHFMKHIKETDEKECVKRLMEINNKFENIEKGVKTMLEVLRKKSNRLYFVSNTDLIRYINGTGDIGSLISNVFNISEVVVENMKIVGIKSRLGDKTEVITLKFTVSTNDQIQNIINNLEVSLKTTLLDSFLFKIGHCSSDVVNKLKEELVLLCTNSLEENTCYSQQQLISIIDEAVSEFKYFSDMKNYNEKSYRIQRLEEYSKTLLNLIDIFPRVGKTSYLFEYYPPTDFIFTELTARIFAAILLARNMSGVILYGPSGTGKTESVKYYCRSIGRQLFVFCCNEKCSFESLKNIVLGCELTGSYICFDEFNRLKKDVMSAMTELIFEKKEKIKIFLTMNLGYKGRSELPKTLKSIFGEILVSSPDIKNIVYYYTGNYDLYNLLVELKKECSSEPFYDFGLRAVRSIFNTNNTNDFFINAIYFYMATLIEKDRHVLNMKIWDIFKIKITDIGLDLSLASIFRMAMRTRNGLLIFGDKGKTGLIRKMAIEILGEWIDNSSSTLKQKVFRYNPSNLLQQNDSVFGSLNKITKEWEDSIFMKDLRTALRTSNVAWFIFDGPISSEWTEDFNSVLDDNRIFCLATGERIKIPFSFKFIFETDSIAEATPATLTRLFFINVNRADLTELIQEEPEIDEVDNTIETIMFIKLDAAQSKTMKQLKKYLSVSRVVFLAGNEGLGKKTLVTELCQADSSNPEIIYGNRRLDISCIKDKKYIVIDCFELANVNLQEQIREFWEYGQIGGVQLMNLKIICCINTDKQRSIEEVGKRLLRIPVTYLNELAEIRQTISRILEIETTTISAEQPLGSYEFEKLVDFLEFLYKTFNISKNLEFKRKISFPGTTDSGTVNLSKIVHFSRLIDSQYLKENQKMLSSYFYFICEVLFNPLAENESALLKDFLTDLTGESVRKMHFDMCNGFTVEEKTQETAFESWLTFLLTRRCNIVVRGPRLCGKRQLVKKCIQRFDDQAAFSIYEWNDSKKIEDLNDKLSPELVHIFILLEDNSYINKKLLNQHAVEINLSNISTTLDFQKVVRGDKLISAVVTTSDMKTTAKGHDNKNHLQVSDLVSVNDSFDCLVNSSLRSCNQYISFSSYFKLVSFYCVFNSLKKDYSTEFESRRAFLKTGIEKIDKFTKDAVDLKISIEKQQLLHQEKKVKLEKVIQVLSEEKVECDIRQKNLEKQQVEINLEVSLCEEKKVVLETKLSEVEKMLLEAKEKITLLTKLHLSEIKGMNNPPKAVRRCIEATYLLLENKIQIPDWGVLQGYVKKEEFISKILHYKGNDKEVTLFVKNSFLERYPFERVENASKTCAMLYNWIKSVIHRDEVQNELIPLRNETRELEERLCGRRKDIEEKGHEIKVVLKRINEIEKSKEELEIESDEIKNSIENLMKDLQVLEEVISRFANEVEEWKFIKFKNLIQDPLSLINDSIILFNYTKELSLSRPVLMSEDFATLRKQCIEVSLKDPSLKKAISNAVYFKRDLLITDVDKFDQDVYCLLKDHIEGYFLQTNGENTNSKRSQRIIIQSNIKGFFDQETYSLVFREKFKVVRESKIEELQNQLLMLLNESTPSLEAIYKQQDLIYDERQKLKEEEILISKYKVLNRCFEQLNILFTQKYGFQLSFSVFKAFVEQSGLIEESNILACVIDFFKDSFANKLSISERSEIIMLDSFCTTMFDFSEVVNYKVDYTFVTSFGDVVFKLKALIAFDIEISAGSPENNDKILYLLREQGNKTVLIKNIHFLQPVIKTGTNRFIFVIEKSEQHPLMIESRVVFVDKMVSFDTLYNNLLKFFKREDQFSKELIRFHAIAVAAKLDFNMKDLEICLSNVDLDPEFIIEIVYLSKLSESERKLIEPEIMKKNRS